MTNLYANKGSDRDSNIPYKIIGKTYDGIPIVEKPRFVTADASQVMRENKTLFLNAGAGLYTQQFSFGYYITPSYLIRFTYARQKDYRDYTAKLYALGLTSFINNNLYVELSLAERKGVEIASSQFALSGFAISSIRKHYGIKSSIGHNWHWKNIFLNIDWISAFVPLDEMNNKDVMFQISYLITTVGISI